MRPSLVAKPVRSVVVAVRSARAVWSALWGIFAWARTERARRLAEAWRLGGIYSGTTL
jgi:hypothetical protein